LFHDVDESEKFTDFDEEEDLNLLGEKEIDLLDNVSEIYDADKL